MVAGTKLGAGFAVGSLTARRIGILLAVNLIQGHEEALSIITVESLAELGSAGTGAACVP